MILDKPFIPWEKDLHGWNSKSQIFFDLVAETRPEVIIEIGTWKGASAASMAHAAIKKGLQTKIYCVDTWLGALEFRSNKEMFGSTWDLMMNNGYPQVYYQFLSNMIHEGILDMIEPVAAPSENAAPHLPKAMLIYVDGQHTYKGVMEDLENYWPKVEDGGIMFGDDYNLDTGPVRSVDGYKAEVKRAVDEFFGARNLKVQIVEDNFWVVRK